MLATPPDKIDRRPAMADAAMDSAPDVKPPPAAPRPLASHQARAHASREPLGERVNLRRLLAIGDVTDVPGGKGAGVRGFFVRFRAHFMLAAFVAAARSAVRVGRLPFGRKRLPEQPRLIRAALGGAPERVGATDAGAEPEGVEQRVEAPPGRRPSSDATT